MVRYYALAFIAASVLAGCPSEVIADDEAPGDPCAVAVCEGYGPCRVVGCSPDGGCYVALDPKGTPCAGGFCNGAGCCSPTGVCL